MECGPLVAIYTRMYQDVLGLQKPWHIADIKIEPHDKTEVILVDFDKGARFDCPKCGTTQCKTHDSHPERKRHLDFHGFHCCIHARVPRIKCPNCKSVVTVDVPWGRRYSGFTYEYEMMVLSFASAMAISKVGNLINENFDRVFRIVSFYVNEWVSNSDHSQVCSIATDETSCRRGHKYITVVIDLNKRRVIFATPGKDHTTIDRFKQFLEEHDGDPANITEGCCDMSPSFIKGLNENFPNISIIFDKFHVMKMMNEALNQVRKMEQKENDALIKTRMYWLKNRDNLKEEEKSQLDKLLQMNLKTVRAYRLKLDLQELWKMNDFEAAKQFLKRWFWRATHSRLKPIQEFGWTIKRHWDGILNIVGSKISNGILEALNGSIQTLKREARGYRNIDNFITMIYLRLGGLDLSEPKKLRQLSNVGND